MREKTPKKGRPVAPFSPQTDIAKRVCELVNAENLTEYSEKTGFERGYLRQVFEGKTNTHPERWLEILSPLGLGDQAAWVAYGVVPNPRTGDERQRELTRNRHRAEAIGVLAHGQQLLARMLADSAHDDRMVEVVNHFLRPALEGLEQKIERRLA